jgi:hypothetical protein
VLVLLLRRVRAFVVALVLPMVRHWLLVLLLLWHRLLVLLLLVLLLLRRHWLLVLLLLVLLLLPVLTFMGSIHPRYRRRLAMEVDPAACVRPNNDFDMNNRMLGPYCFFWGGGVEHW